MTKHLGIGILVGVVATILIAIAGWLAVVYTGAYNVAATDPHADIARWTLDTTMRRSIETRAGEIVAPEAPSAELFAAGARTYASTCAHCHGAPGAERESWARNMRPMPPELAEHADEWEEREIFWIAKHGIKMSGMPAFGPEHSDEELWGLTVFVTHLPGMTPEEYRSMTGEAGAGHGRTE